MGNDGVNSKVLTDGIKFLNIKYRILVSPINITRQWVFLFRKMVVRITNAIRPINGYGAAYAKHVMATSPYHGIVWYSHPSTMLDGVIIKVGRIVMVASDKKNPIVRLSQAITITVIDILIITLLLKPKATISSNYYH